jgi:hypothetical protein
MLPDSELHEMKPAYEASLKITSRQGSLLMDSPVAKASLKTFVGSVAGHITAEAAWSR